MTARHSSSSVRLRPVNLLRPEVVGSLKDQSRSGLGVGEAAIDQAKSTVAQAEASLKTAETNLVVIEGIHLSINGIAAALRNSG